MLHRFHFAAAVWANPLQYIFWVQKNDNTNRRVTSSWTNSRALAHADNECEFRSTWQSQTGNPPTIMCILGRTGHHIKLKQIRRDCGRPGTSWHEQKHIIKSHIRSRQIRPPTGDRTRHEPGTERHQKLTYIYIYIYIWEVLFAIVMQDVQKEPS